MQDNMIPFTIKPCPITKKHILREIEYGCKKKTL